MIAVKLKELRGQKGLSQAALANILNVSQQAVARWETNKNMPDNGTLRNIADYFNISVDELIGRHVDDLREKDAVMATLSNLDEIKFSLDLQKDPKKKAFWDAFKNLFMSDQENQQATLPEVPYSKETKKIPIIASVKCGPNGLAFEEDEGHVMVDDSYHGNIKAFRCRGDSMTGIGIYEGDIAIVRMQEEVEDGALAVVVINGEEGALKRVRRHEDVLILESYNVAYPPRVFTGKEMNDVKIVGKVMETRRVY